MQPNNSRLQEAIGAKLISEGDDPSSYIFYTAGTLMAFNIATQEERYFNLAELKKEYPELFK